MQTALKVTWALVMAVATLFIAFKQYELGAITNRPKLYIEEIARFAADRRLPAGHSRQYSHVLVISNAGSLDADGVCLKVKTRYLGNVLHVDERDCRWGTIVANGKLRYAVVMHEPNPPLDLRGADLTEEIEIEYIGAPKVLFFGRQRCLYEAKLKFSELESAWRFTGEGQIARCS